MIYTQASVQSLVTETFTRKVKEGQHERHHQCIKLKPGIARTLALTRFVQLEDPAECKPQKDDRRRLTSVGIAEGGVIPNKLPSWRNFALSLAGVDGEKSPRLLLARQMSRLMVGMAGGVFENGGLTLDRLSGIPLIPGSAVKGCARRAILAALHEWSSGVLQPRDAANPLSPLIDGFKEAADLLVEIALIFGWSDLEWQGREDFKSDKEWEEKRPDIAWACGEKWQAIRQTAAAQLCARFCITPKDANKPWKSLPHFAGTVSFLPAYPWDKDPGIDLDVITCHHGDYYKCDDPNAVATDTEEPVPVIFPAVRPGQTWCFLLHPTNRAAAADLTNARRWLAHGLEIFGIGGKTNAGYGWFEVPDLAAEKAAADEAAMALLQEEAAKKNAELLCLSADKSVLQKLSDLRENELRAVINKFTVDDKWWPKAPAPESASGFHLALLQHLTVDNRVLYEAEKGNAKSKIIVALQKLADLYARKLTD
jgi:CRISPR-associated protein Cmr6